MVPKLLIDESPLQVLPSLANVIGLNEAIFIQQLHYWLIRSKHMRDGRKWIYNTHAQWVTQFPFWSQHTIMRTVKHLVYLGLIHVNQFNKKKWDRKNWYSIDYHAFETLCLTEQLSNNNSTNLAVSEMPTCQPLEAARLQSSLYTETTHEITPQETTPRKITLARATKPRERRATRPRDGHVDHPAIQAVQSGATRVLGLSEDETQE